MTYRRSGPLAAILLLLAPAAARAQYALSGPDGDTLRVTRDSIHAMLDTTRALYRFLQSDPRILYYTNVGEAVPPDRPSDAFPWNAFEVRNDSVAAVRTPGNLRESDRAYFNYAVTHMQWIHARTRPADCEERMGREMRALDLFTQGWIVSRTLYGGPPYPPLDEFAFARAAGFLEALAADHDDVRMGQDCLADWKQRHADRLAAYRAWRQENFRPAPASAAASPPATDSTPTSTSAPPGRGSSPPDSADTTGASGRP